MSVERTSLTCIILACLLTLGLFAPGASAETAPLAWYEFENNAQDSSGNNYHGTVNGDPQYVAGYVDTAMQFDGAGDSVIIDQILTDDFTIAMWVNTTQTAGGGHWWAGVGLVDAEVAGGGTDFGTALIGNNFGFGIGSGTDVTITSTSPINDGEWHHCTAVRVASSGLMEVYVDGVSENTGTGDTATRTFAPRISIGMIQTEGGYYNGLLDDIRLYDVALSVAEIRLTAGLLAATGPVPADGAAVSPDVWEENVYLLLDYTPGPLATKHTAYFSDVEQDVRDRDPSHSLGSIPPWPAVNDNAFVVGYDDENIPEFARTPLVRGKTYYWAVDAQDGDTIWPGEVWSFTPVPKQAWGPDPADEAELVSADGTMSWKLGDMDPTGYALSYDVYIGTSEAAVDDANVVNNPSVAEFVANVSVESHDYSGLTALTEYFWRIDTKLQLTRPPFTSKYAKGDVWSFTTLPVIDCPECDPDLVVWLKLDGDIMPGAPMAFDSSGNNNHGEIFGGAASVPGQVDNGLDFDGADDYVGTGKAILANETEWTMAGWVSARNPGDARIGLFGQNDVIEMGFMNGNAEIWTSAAGTTTTPWPYPNETWHHITVVADSTGVYIYLDGALAVAGAGAANYGSSSFAFNVGGGGIWDAGGNWFDGQIDDVRVYKRALTEREIKIIAGLLKASNPDPADGSGDAPKTPTLDWNPGVFAAAVNGSVVYYSTDEDAVINRTAPSATVSTPPYTVPMTLNLGEVFYWAVDTVNGVDAWPGDVWSFTVQNWRAVDDMETYTPWTTPGNNIFEAWRDGEGNCSPGNGNDTGSVLTENMDAAFVLGGTQSMKYDFDNDGLVYSPCTMNNTPRAHKYSKIEAQVATLSSGIGTDWTVEGVKALQINFMGQLGNSTTDPLWVQLQDSSKAYGTKVFYGDFEGEDLADMNDPSWHQWDIDLADFNVDLTNVVSIVIGIGNEGSAVAGGSGTIYVDEIRLYTPRCMPNRAKPAADFDNSCQVDYPDLAALFNNWLLEDVPEVADSGWMTTDIGDVNVLTGSYTDLGGGEFTMTGAGADIWGTADGGFYRYKSLSGDGRLTVRVTDIAGPSTNDWRKAGVMIRETLDAGSKHAFMATSPVGGGGKSLQRRIETDQASTSAHGIPPTVTTPICLRIARQGDTFRGFYNIGGGWVQHGDPVTIEMAENVYIGFAITSHDYSNSTTVTFDNVCSGDFIEPDLVEDGVINFEDYADLLNQWLDQVFWP